MLKQEVIYNACITDLVGYFIPTSGRAMKWSTKTIITLDWFLQINNENSLFHIVDIFRLSEYLEYSSQ